MHADILSWNTGKMWKVNVPPSLKLENTFAHVIFLSNAEDQYSWIVINRGKGGSMPVAKDAANSATDNPLHSCQPGVCCSPRPKQVSAKAQGHGGGVVGRGADREYWKGVINSHRQLLEVRSSIVYFYKLRFKALCKCSENFWWGNSRRDPLFLFFAMQNTTVV